MKPLFFKTLIRVLLFLQIFFLNIRTLYSQPPVGHSVVGCWCPKHNRWEDCNQIEAIPANTNHQPVQTGPTSQEIEAKRLKDEADAKAKAEAERKRLEEERKKKEFEDNKSNIMNRLNPNISQDLGTAGAKDRILTHIDDSPLARLNSNTTTDEEKRIKDLLIDEKTLSVKKTSAQSFSNLKNTKEGINTGNFEIMSKLSGSVFDTKGDNRGSIEDVKIKLAITPAREKAIREYLEKNDKEYQARQIKLKKAKEMVSEYMKKDRELSETIENYEKKFKGKTAPKEESDRYSKCIQEQGPIKGQLLYALSTENELQQKDQAAIVDTFRERKIPGEKKSH